MLADLRFEVLNVRPEKYAAQPTLIFRLRIGETTGVPVHSLAVKCQIRIEPQKLSYSTEQESQLFDLFSDVSRWDDTLHPFLWTHVSLMVPRFEESTEIDMPVSVSYDLEVASGKYFQAVRSSGVPLVFLFSGMIFADSPTGLSVQPISWDCEAEFTLPAGTWEELMNLYFPNSGWLRVDREIIDLLERFKAENALATWDATLRALIEKAEGRLPA